MKRHFQALKPPEPGTDSSLLSLPGILAGMNHGVLPSPEIALRFGRGAFLNCFALDRRKALSTGAFGWISRSKFLAQDKTPLHFEFG